LKKMIGDYSGKVILLNIVRRVAQSHADAY
jgi:hypothetical protein